MIWLKTNNQNAFNDKAFFLYFLGAFILLANSCSISKNASTSRSNDPGWELVKAEKGDEPSWKIHSRQLPGTNIYEYKIEGNIVSTPKACLDAFRRDILSLADGSKINKKLTTYQLLDHSRDSLMTYVIHNEPFPLKDTEMCVRYIFDSEKAGNTSVKWREAWDQTLIEPSKKLNRIDMFRGSWSFSMISDQTTKAVNTVQFDPKKMPLWLVNPMVIKFLRNGLETTREMVGDF